VSDVSVLTSIGVSDICQMPSMYTSAE